MKIFILSSIFLCAFFVSSAQNNPPAKLKIFIDCRVSCDENYIRSNIAFVDFVIDRLAADVHVLITSQRNGGGGSTVQIIFFGQNNFKQRSDTLIYNQMPDASGDEKRIQITKRIRLGLIPFLSKLVNAKVASPDNNILREKNTDTVKAPLDKIVPSVTTKDKWNYWVYKIGADGRYSVDQNYKSSNISSYVTANRTTDKLKVNFSMSAQNDNSTYKYEDSGRVTRYKVSNKSYSISHSLVKSISEHWSLGYEMSFSNNTFSNIKSKKYFATGIEYAIFPYKAVNSKFFTISYILNVRHNNYYDTTIYNKIAEVLLGQEIEAKLSLNQKWGYVNAGISYYSFFKDVKLNNLLLTLDVNIRITGGLSFYIYTYGELIHDQVYLVKGNATIQEILTRRRQLASSYSFYSGAGLSFRFGSILNNFVNPRFSK